MALLTSLLVPDHGLVPMLILSVLVAFVPLLRFIFSYVRARRQFPGPPVRNIFVGNLDETMRNDVHEKVRSLK